MPKTTWIHGKPLQAIVFEKSTDKTFLAQITYSPSVDGQSVYIEPHGSYIIEDSLRIKSLESFKATKAFQTHILPIQIGDVRKEHKIYGIYLESTRITFSGTDRKGVKHLVDEMPLPCFETRNSGLHDWLMS